MSKYRTLTVLMSENREFLPKLEHFWDNGLYRLEICSLTVNKLKLLSDKYSQTIKTLHIGFYGLESEEQLKTCIEYITRFENLKELKLRINSNQFNGIINRLVSLIGQKCNKLLKLDLSINDSILISNQFSNVLKEF